MQSVFYLHPFLKMTCYENGVNTDKKKAVNQVHGYAHGEKVNRMCHGTELHLIVMQFRGCEPLRIEEVWERGDNMLRQSASNNPFCIQRRKQVHPKLAMAIIV